MLSPEVRQRLEAARLNEQEYRPKAVISRELGEKTLIMLVGPAAVGKTLIMKQAKELDSRFGLVPAFSTRDARPDDDPAMFHLLPHNDQSVTKLLNRIEKGEVVNYAVHPTQDRIYGTDLEDFDTDFNQLATLSGSVDHFLGLPFKETHIIGLTAEPAIWGRWFNERYPATNPSRQSRLEEAALSLEWLLNPKRRSSVTFIKNIDGNPSVPAQQIIDAVLTGEKDDGDAHSQASGMLVLARGALNRLLSERG